MKELIIKLAASKKEIGKISKESTNPFFNSKYFDINQLLEHTEKVLEKHKLLILQPIENGKVCSKIFDIETGESIESSIEYQTNSDPQKLGSAITYYRRYTLQSLLSLQAEDDDANKASGHKKQSAQQQTEDDNKAWLNADQIDKAVEYLKDNNLDLKEVRNFYKVSNKNFEILKQKFNM